MKRLFIGIAILGVVAFIAYQFLFADRRSRLRVDHSNNAHYEVSEASFVPQQKSKSMGSYADRLLAREGSMSFEVSDAMKTRDAINDLAKGFDGYIASENLVTNDGKIRYFQKVRVPSGSLDEFLRRLEKFAEKTDSKQLSATDVTEEFIDLKSRLITKRKMESQYQEIIKLAGTIKDILEIETQIGAARAEIESMEGRLTYLENQISFATLDLEFYEHGASTAGFGNKIRTSLNAGWSGLLLFIVAIAHVWPLLIVATAGVWFYLRRKRKQLVTFQ